MTTLGEIKSQLRALHARGAGFDGELDAFIRQSVRYIERRRRFDYMYRWFNFQLDPNSQYPRTIKLDANKVKAIDLVRLVLEDGTYKSLDRRPALNSPAVIVGLPDFYWVVQNNLLVLDKIPEKCWEVELALWEFSTVEPADAFTHWLFDNFEEGLIARTMSLIYSRFRDRENSDRQANMFEDYFTTLVMSEEDSEGSNTELVMTGAG